MGKELLTEVENDDIRKQIKERDQNRELNINVTIEEEDAKRKQERLVE